MIATAACIGQQLKSRALFVAYEGESIKLFSSDVIGSKRKALLTVAAPFKNAPVYSALSVSVSPDRKLIGYMMPGRTGGSVYVMETDGGNRRKIIENASGFYWGPKSDSLLYKAIEPSLITDDYPAFGPYGADWYRVWLGDEKEERIADKTLSFTSLIGWINDRRLLFLSTDIVGNAIYEFNAVSRMKKKVDAPPQHYFLENITVSHDGERAVATYNQPGYRCVFYGLRPENASWKKLFAEDYICRGISWNGSNEFYYTVWREFPYENRLQHGTYKSIRSVYKYDFLTGRNVELIKGDGDRTFYMARVLTNKRVAVISNRIRSELRSFSLDIFTLAGKNPVRIYSSDKDISFVGWIEN